MQERFFLGFVIILINVFLFTSVNVCAIEKAPEKTIEEVQNLNNETLVKAVNNYMQTPSSDTFREFTKTFRNILLSSPNTKLPAAAILANYPSLSQIGTKAIDISGGRLWVFTKVGDNHEAIVQCLDTKSRVIKVGRRKKVVHDQVSHIESIGLPNAVVIREGKLINGKDGFRLLVLAGDKTNGTIWLKAYRMIDGHFKESSQYFASVPSFLLDDVSGWVSFHGNDLICTVSPMKSSPASNASVASLPESERSTYKFCLRISQAGYVLESGIVDVAPYSVLCQFVQAIKQGRADIAKAHVIDSKLMSIPKYIGLNANYSHNYKVTQMAASPSGTYRYRLLTGLKDDLIIDVVSIKSIPANKIEPFRYDWLIKAIFVAPADKFLQTIAENLPQANLAVVELHDANSSHESRPQAVSVKTIKTQP
jgi:molybdate-binding protein